MTLHLVKRLTSAGGEQAAAALLRNSAKWPMQAVTSPTGCRSRVARSRPKEALAYDALITSWPEI